MKYRGIRGKEGKEQGIKIFLDHCLESGGGGNGIEQDRKA